MLLISAVLFVAYATLVLRRASQTLWFLSLAASSLPMFASLIPIAHSLHTAKHWNDYLDAGGDVLFLLRLAEREFVISLAFSGIFAALATYGYFARRKT